MNPFLAPPKKHNPFLGESNPQYKDVTPPTFSNAPRTSVAKPFTQNRIADNSQQAGALLNTVGDTLDYASGTIPYTLSGHNPIKYDPKANFPRGISGQSKELAQEVYGDIFPEPAVTGIGLAIGVIGDPANFIGGGAKGLYKTIEGLTDLNKARNFAKIIGVEDDLLDTAAEAFVKASNPKEAQAAYDSLLKLQSTTKVAPVAPKTPEQLAKESFDKQWAAAYGNRPATIESPSLLQQRKMAGKPTIDAPLTSKTVPQATKPETITGTLPTQRFGTVDVRQGEVPVAESTGYGTAKIEAKNLGLSDAQISQLIDTLPVKSETANRIVLQDNKYRILLSKDWFGKPTERPWLMNVVKVREAGVEPATSAVSGLRSAAELPAYRKPSIPTGKVKDLSTADKLIAEGKIRVVSREGRDTYQYKKDGEWKTAPNEMTAVDRVALKPTPTKFGNNDKVLITEKSTGKTATRFVYNSPTNGLLLKDPASGIPKKVDTSRFDIKIIEPNSAEAPKTQMGINSPEMLLEELKTEIAIREDAIQSMPGRELMKYVSKTTGRLPEITGKEKMRSLTGSGKVVKTSNFGRRGDDIIQNEVGLADNQAGQDAVDAYQHERQIINELKAYASELRKETKSSPVLKTERQKDIRPTEIPKEEVRSIEAQAEQALSKVDESIRGEIPSLPKIVEQTFTNVKDKVNVLDYLRTPDRVLQKIGFGPEAKELRQQYEGYIKELPKNIDKITEWSKRVPKAASERIFKYLDGQTIELNEAEKAVALEVKGWLGEWAKRLKLPEDKTITNYITHIFDKELIAKEFDEDLAKIITDKVPGSVYDPFLLKRLGAKGYRQNAWEALDAYVKRGTRKAYLDPVLEKIQTKAGSSLELSNIESSQWKYIQRYTSNINMRPTELDNLIDAGVKSVVGYKFGQRPVTYLTQLLRRMTYRGMLGLNPGSALRNISQGINTYAVLGEKYTAVGYAKLLNRGSWKELEEQGVLQHGFIQDRALSSTKKAIEKMDKGLFVFFEGAERINRGSAYFGAKSKAISQGASESEAIDFAKSVVRKTQFAFGSVDTPVALQSDIAKTLMQFQNFTLKQVEFLGEMAKDKNFVGLLRYAVAGTAFVYTIGKAFGMEPKDLIPGFRLGTPPSLKLPVEATKAVLDVPDKYGNQRDFGEKANDIFKSGIGLFPAGTQIKKSVEGVTAAQQGESTDKAGRHQFDVGGTTLKNLQALLFGKYAGQDAKEYFDKKEGGGKKVTTSNPFLK